MGAVREIRAALALWVLTVSLLAALPATAEAVFPVEADNGRIAYTAGGDIWTVDRDGTDATNLTTSAATETCALMAPDGSKIAFNENGIWVMNVDGGGRTRLPSDPGLGYELWSCLEDWYPNPFGYLNPNGAGVTFAHDDHCDAGGVWNVYLDGRPMSQVRCGPPECSHDTTPWDPDWNATGSKVAVVGCPQFFSDSDVWVIHFPGGGSTRLTFTPDDWEREPNFSPVADTLVFNLGGTLYRIDADGTDQTPLATGGASSAVWSSDGSMIAFTKAGEVWTMNADGSNQVNVTNDPATDSGPVWSPDGKQLAFRSNRDGDQDVYVINRDGTGITNVTNTTGTNENLVGWQPIPINYYPRPKGASPFRASLTTAYKPCASPDRQHGPPLAFGSCSSPDQTSAYLTVGTGDSNALPARNEGHLLLRVQPGIPSTPADEADVQLDFFLDDVFTTALADYSGELRARVPLQVTDKNNAGPGGPAALTVLEFPFELVVPCIPVADPQEGSSCAATTTADALSPGIVKEARRSIWQLGKVEVYDGGADGDAHTPSGDTLFATQGVFIP